MTPRSSLRKRLLVASALILPLFLILSGSFLSRAHEQGLVAAQQEQLSLRFYGVLGAMESNNGDVTIGDRLQEAKFDTLNSGLYAWINDPLRDEPLWRSHSSLSLGESLMEAVEIKSGEGMFIDDTDNDLFFYHYQIVWERSDGREWPIQISIAESRAATRAQLKTFNRQLWFWLSGAALFLALSLLLILNWGLSPLRRLATELDDLEQGQQGLLKESYPDELLPLTVNLNKLLERERQQRSRYRNTLADLAHSLKTPLAAIRGNAEVDRNPEARQQLDRMSEIISYHLNRASTAGPATLGENTQIAPTAGRLIATMEKVHASKGVRFETEISDDAQFPGDEQDLMELLGNLLDNAAKACQQQVRLSADAHSLSIEDDGPGIPEIKREEILQRGRRADTYGSGQGIGLALVREIAAAYSAELEIGESELGGAKVTLHLPTS